MDFSNKNLYIAIRINLVTTVWVPKKVIWVQKIIKYYINSLYKMSFCLIGFICINLWKMWEPLNIINIINQNSEIVFFPFWQKYLETFKWIKLLIIYLMIYKKVSQLVLIASILSYMIIICLRSLWGNDLRY